MDYRLYQLGDGGFRRAGDIACNSDDEATCVAEAVRCGRPMELWCGPRLVAAWTSASAPEPRAVAKSPQVCAGCGT